MKSAVRLCRFLHGIHFEGYSRARAASALECDAATVTRALRFLEDSGAISRARGGRSTSAKIRPLMSLAAFLRRYQECAAKRVEMRRYQGQNAPLSGDLNLKVVIQERKRPHTAQTNYSPDTWRYLVEEGRKLGFTEEELPGLLAQTGLRKAGGA